MFNYSLALTILKIITPVWALIVMCVDAAFIAKYNQYWSGYNYGGSGFSSANAIIACAIFVMVYFGVALYFIFYSPHHILISVMVDTVCIGFLFIFALGSVAAMTSLAGWWGDYAGYNLGPLSDAVIGLGWVMTFLLLAILLLEVILTLVHYGGSLETWKTPINQLLLGNTSRRPGVSTETKAEAVPAAPVGPYGVETSQV